MVSKKHLSSASKSPKFRISTNVIIMGFFMMIGGLAMGYSVNQAILMGAQPIMSLLTTQLLTYLGVPTEALGLVLRMRGK